MFKPRTALASLAAIAALGAIGAGDAAARAMPTDLDGPTMQQQLKPDRVVHLEVFPTGDGPADEETCDGFDTRIEIVQAQLVSDLKAGDGDSALQQAEALDNLENMAMDAGCAIIY